MITVDLEPVTTLLFITGKFPIRLYFRITSYNTTLITRMVPSCHCY